MNLPVKPWELSTSNHTNMMNNTSSVTTPSYVSNTDRLHSTAIPFPGGGGGSTSSVTLAPPLPPRPNQTRPIYSAYNRGSLMPYSYSSPYSSYGYGSGGLGGGYTPYSPYNSYGYGGGNFYGSRPYGSGYEQGGDPSFSQFAEESSASAFQSIESFVSAFGSISMMLESTFQALYSSFRAVVGVADHLGRVKQVLSALAIFRFFKWMLRRIMYLIGISKIKPETIESLWSQATNPENSPDGLPNMFLGDETATKTSSWPILMFLGFIFAGPYLMWKVIKSLNVNGSQSDQSRGWATGKSEHFVAEVTYPFDAAVERELSLKSGQTIRLAPAKCQPNNVRGWALASDGARIGLVPLNYIKVLGRRSGGTLLPVPVNPNQNTVSSSTDCSSHGSKPRVRFDLNPKTVEIENQGFKPEPQGILIRNGHGSSSKNDCPEEAVVH